MSAGRVVAIAAVLAAAAWTATAARTRPAPPQQEAQEDAHPGPDSARVTRLLAVFGKAGMLPQLGVLLSG